MRTRHPKKRPEAFPLTVEINGKLQDIDVPAKDHFVPLILPLFAPPAFLSKRPYRSGIEFIGLSVADKFSGRSIEELNRRYGEGKWGFRLEYEPMAFTRMIAKIGYGIAVGEVGLDEIEESYVLPAILGKRKDVGRWVGCDEGEGKPLTGAGGLHEIGLILRGRALHAIVRLFAQFEAEEYRVVVGRVSAKAVTKLRSA